MNPVLADDPRLNGRAEIEAELQQQFVEEVLLSPAGFDVIDYGEEFSLKVIGSRVPRTDARCVELEDAEAEIA